MHTVKNTRIHCGRYPKNMWISGSISNRRRLQVQEFNDVITCFLCRGYLINPTTIDNCIHSYCRSCIVQYIARDSFCPQCKPTGGKPLSLDNLKSDEVLRSLVFKLVPGIYQQERENMLQFSSSLKTDELKDIVGGGEPEEEFFSPAEPISLSLEYHPALLTACSEDEIPPIRYLQCPAGVMVHHLKRFLCSKYDIDPGNRQVEIEIIYEEEVLPSDFTLMDVGYCYNWRRIGPMRFRYRILIHKEITQDVAQIHPKPDHKQFRAKDCTGDSDATSCRKTVRFTDPSPASVTSLPPPMSYTVFKSKAQEFRLGTTNNNNHKVNSRSSLEREFGIDENLLNEGNGPVKVIIARKHSDNKKSSPKRSHSSEEASYVVTNDFKSLRSNDLRYSDYTVTSTTSSNYASRNKPPEKGTDSEARNNPVSKCDIVVSIPQSQLSRSPNSAGESLSLSQLKTANKKSPTSPSSKPKNVPKLKIELGSLKTKITIPKPRSAEVAMGQPQPKKSKHRKYSVEDYGPTADKVDLETYVKNIGLKPIEVLTAPEALEAEKDKYSPDASPMSSSSSTTSSSNGNFLFTSSSEITSSSHKKRKKKHSRDSKDPNGKRRKLHAEISSQPADESLKMKVKITASHGHKTHRTESRKTSMKNVDVLAEPQVEFRSSDGMKKPDDPKCDTNNEAPAVRNTNSDISNGNHSSAANISSLNETLSEESARISNLMTGQQLPTASTDEVPPSSQPSVSFLTAPSESLAKPLLPKPLSSIKDIKIPSSPPLPPSLFKTTPLTMTTTAALSTSASSKTSPSLMPPFIAKPAQKIAVKPPSPVQVQNNQAPGLKTHNTLAKTQSFAVPNPPRSMPNSPKLCSLPTSIASAAHKQMGAQLKRSASLDEPHTPSALAKHQEKLGWKNSCGNAQVSSYVRPNAAAKDGTLLKLKPAEKSYYSTISSAYNHELSKRKAMAANLSPSAISVSRINETFSLYTNPRVSTPSLTITTHPKQTATQQMINFLPYTPLSKPALEIMRVASNQVPADMQPLPLKSPPKRPAQPPIPLLKIKKPGQQSTPRPTPPTAKSPPAPSAKTATPAQKSPPALINMRNTIPLTVATKATAGKELSPKVAESKSNGSVTPDKPKASLRDFRPTSKDGSVEILDLSSNKSQENQKPTPVQTTIGNNLEAALNKIKQNITSCTVMESLQAGKLNAAKSTNDDLQNLHMLSESATSREKIAIKPQQKLFEMPKATQASVVRQQNASVRNIPNPSALAFRNQPSLSMLATVASPPSPQLQPTTTADAKTLSPPSLFVGSPRSPNVPHLTSPRAKKHPSIDQVAANLNIRAAAAEAEATAAKAASMEEASVVSSSAVAEAKPAATSEEAATVADSAPAPTSSAPASTSTTATTATTASTTSASIATTTVSETVASSPPETATSPPAPASSPSPPKTSFRSISSLVAPTPAPSAVAGSV